MNVRLPRHSFHLHLMKVPVADTLKTLLPLLMSYSPTLAPMHQLYLRPNKPLQRFPNPSLHPSLSNRSMLQQVQEVTFTVASGRSTRGFKVSLRSTMEVFRTALLKLRAEVAAAVVGIGWAEVAICKVLDNRSNRAKTLASP